MRSGLSHGALGANNDTEAVLDMLYDPEIVTVFQFAPAVRVGFGEEFGLPAGTNVEGKIITALRKIGADIVLDTNFAADVVIMEEGTELLHRLTKKQRPTFTSCCPAWINFAERHYPDLLPLLSSTSRRSNASAPSPRATCRSAWASTPNASAWSRSCLASPRRTSAAADAARK